MRLRRLGYTGSQIGRKGSQDAVTRPARPSIVTVTPALRVAIMGLLAVSLAMASPLTPPVSLSLQSTSQKRSGAER